MKLIETILIKAPHSWGFLFVRWVSYFSNEIITFSFFSFNLITIPQTKNPTNVGFDKYGFNQLHLILFHKLIVDAV